MFNLAATEYRVTKGDRIAQLVLERILTPPVLEVGFLSSLLFFLFSIPFFLILSSIFTNYTIIRVSCIVIRSELFPIISLVIVQNL